MKNKLSLVQQFKRAINVGTPLITITCFDPEATMAGIQKSMNGDGPALVQWDTVRGWRSRNEKGDKAIAKAIKGADITATINEVKQLEMAMDFPEDTILFVLNGQHYVSKPKFSQALWNLRDEFKAKFSAIVLLAPQMTLPAELQQDVLVLDDPLPSDSELEAIVVKNYAAAKEDLKIKSPITKDIIEKAVAALRGLAAFPAEQAVAMCLSKEGLDIDGLWDRKRQMISETPGLSVYSGQEKFNDIGGCEQVKNFLRGVLTGKEAPNVIVFIDEGEKMFAGATADHVGDSGASKDILGTTLKFMEDSEAEGVIFVGVRGAAKSAIAKAAGNEAGIPTIALDLGAVKGGIVGETEHKIRQAYKVIDAVGGGRAYFIMTCNKDATFPPELERRFTAGKFFFDVPDADTFYKEREERDGIWPIYLKKYGIEAAQLKGLNDDGWTGAEIRNCTRMAYRQNLSLKEAAEYIIPVSVSGGAQLTQLRQQASDVYLSANKRGRYTYRPSKEEKGQKSERRSFRNSSSGE
jgi:hypothetical protein